MFGLLSTGFVPKTIEIIREEINQSLQAAYGTSLDVSDGSALGQFVGIFAEREALLWELTELVNDAFDPDAATDAALDALSALTGTLRDAATFSTVTLTLTGTPATLVALGSVSSVVGTEDEFSTDIAASIAALTAWAPTTAYVIGDRVTNVGNAYICTVGGTSAGAGGPSTEGEVIVDGTVTWRFMGNGTGAVDVASTAAATGPTVAVSGDITQIETPVAGWDSVINLLDADVGTTIESDEGLRVRRELDLADPGSGNIDAIRAALLNLDGVTDVTVFENDTDVTVDGIPPHAVEALVRGGTDQDIFDELLASVAAGIETHGTESGTSIDSEGTSHAIEFTRPTEILIFDDIVIIKDVDTYPVDGDAQIKAAIVAFGDQQPTGKDVVSASLKAQCFTVAGVLDVTAGKIGIAPAPTLETTIAIALRELAVHDTSRITVDSSASATP